MKWLIPIILVFTFNLPGKGISIDEIKTRIKSTKDSGNFQANYDRFTDNSFITIKPFNLFNSGTKIAGAVLAQASARHGSPMIFGRKKASNIVFSLELSAGFPFKGERLLEEPKLFTFTVTTMAAQWQFLEIKSIYFIADGERIEMQAIDRKSTIGDGSVSETLSFLVPSDTIAKIANAKKVELKAAQAEKEVKGEFLGLLKILLGLGKV